MIYVMLKKRRTLPILGIKEKESHFKDMKTFSKIIITGNFPFRKRGANQIQEAFGVSNKQDKERIVPPCHIIKILNIHNKESIMKVKRERATKSPVRAGSSK